MLFLPHSVRVFIASQPCDMRRGFDSLARVVKEMGHDVFAGHLFLFMSKRRDRCKILTWHHGGFVLYYKRLEKGRFPTLTVHADSPVASIDAATLAMVLDGVDCKKVHRASFWEPKSQQGDRLTDPGVIKEGHEHVPCTASTPGDPRASSDGDSAPRQGAA